jgi:hypothetical protein
LSRFFFEQRGRALAQFATGSPTLLDLPAENERLRAALRPILKDAVASDHIADINETTLQHLSEATAPVAGPESPEARADRIRRVFQSAARERAPMLARLLTTHQQPQFLTNQ